MGIMVKALCVAGAVLTVLTGVGTAAPDTNLLLIEAARNRDAATVRTLLNQGVDVNGRSETAQPRSSGLFTGTTAIRPTC